MNISYTINAETEKLIIDTERPEPELDVTQLVPDQQKSVHLVTWSKANNLFLLDPDNPRESFAQTVTDLFNSKAQCVEYWACSRENHHLDGHHYHLCIKFSRKVRWKQVSNNLKKRGIYVHFQSFQTSYVDAFQYTTQEDTEFKRSANHQPMIMILPKSMRPSRKRTLPSPNERSSSFLQHTPTPLTDHDSSMNFLEST